MITAKENYLRTIFHQNPEWVPFMNEAVITVLPPICERPAESGFDVFGTKWIFVPEAEGGTYPAQGNYVITDIENWKTQLRIPDVSQFDWTAAKEKAAAIDRSRYLVSGFIEMGIFERIYLLMGMEEALVAFCTNELELYDLAGAIADYKIQFLTKYHETVNMDLLWYGDDWGTQSNLFIPPQTWQKIIKPHTKRIYDCAKSLGIIINQHSCGKIETILPDIVEMGADIWNPCQPCNDLKLMKHKYGDRICFCGGIDSQFILDNPNADANAVVEEVKRRINEMSADNGGYIAGPSHEVPYDPIKLDAMYKTINEYGRKIR